MLLEVSLRIKGVAVLERIHLQSLSSYNVWIVGLSNEKYDSDVMFMILEIISPKHETWDFLWLFCTMPTTLFFLILLIFFRQTDIKTRLTRVKSDMMSLSVTTMSALAGALVSLGYLPDKLNPVIKPLMESIKKEPIYQLQKLSAQKLVALLDLCIQRCVVTEKFCFRSPCKILMKTAVIGHFYAEIFMVYWIFFMNLFPSSFLES